VAGISDARTGARFGDPFQRDEGLALLARSVDLEPAWALAHYQYGTALEYTCRYKEASGEYAKALRTAVGDLKVKAQTGYDTMQRSSPPAEAAPRR
jgi:hypothetical protein